MQLVRRIPRQRWMMHRNTLPSLMDDFFAPMWTQQGSTQNGFMPSVDIYEKDETLFFEVEVPGFDKEALNVDVHGKALTISGEREEKKEEETGNNLRKERRYGRFERRFKLGFDADPASIKASYENGILRVEVKKPEEQKIKQIQIH